MTDMHRIAAQTIEVLRKAKVPEMKMAFTQVGATSGEGFAGGGSGGASAGTVTAVLQTDHKASVSQIQDRVRPYFRDIPDARVGIQALGFGSAAIQVVLTSTDGNALDKAGEELERQMRGLKDVVDPRPSAPPIGPEIVIRPKPDQASRLGVTVQSIASIARVATIGDIDANVPKLTQGERRIPIRVRLPVEARTNIDMIRALQVPTISGGTTPLSSVADVDFQAGPAVINRYGRQRMFSVDADLANGAQLGQGLAEANRLPIMRHLPAGVTLASTGQAQEFGELFGQLGLAFFTGVAMIYAVLVLLFRSFFKPITIISALPLAIGGAFMGLLVMHLSVSLPSLIGLLMLLGLAAKNSILLVEYAIERERAGVPQREAIMEACRERARPIVMTTMAMAAGMLPTALTLGKGSEFRQPMAVAVIGGLMTSTILSLVMVPVVYEVIDDIDHWLRPRLAPLITPRDQPRRGRGRRGRLNHRLSPSIAPPGARRTRSAARRRRSPGSRVEVRAVRSLRTGSRRDPSPGCCTGGRWG